MATVRRRRVRPPECPLPAPLCGMLLDLKASLHLSFRSDAVAQCRKSSVAALDMICKSNCEMTHPRTLPRHDSQDLALALQSGYSLPLLLSSHGLNAAGPGPLPLHAALGLPSLELPKVRVPHNELPAIIRQHSVL